MIPCAPRNFSNIGSRIKKTSHCLQGCATHWQISTQPPALFRQQEQLGESNARRYLPRSFIASPSSTSCIDSNTLQRCDAPHQCSCSQSSPGPISLLVSFSSDLCIHLEVSRVAICCADAGAWVRKVSVTIEEKTFLETERVMR